MTVGLLDCIPPVEKSAANLHQARPVEEGLACPLTPPVRQCHLQAHHRGLVRRRGPAAAALRPQSAYSIHKYIKTLHVTAGVDSRACQHRPCSKQIPPNTHVGRITTRIFGFARARVYIFTARRVSKYVPKYYLAATLAPATLQGLQWAPPIRKPLSELSRRQPRAGHDT